MNPNDPRPDDMDFRPRDDDGWGELPTARRDGEPLPVLPGIPEVIPAGDAYRPRDYAGPPRPPGPGFGMSLLWCVLLWVVMIFAAIPAFLIAAIAESPAGQDVAEFLKAQAEILNDTKRVTEPLARIVATTMLVGEIASVLFVLVIVRSAVGRNWPRVFALRLPRLDHLVLALLVLPGLMILHGAAHEIGQLLFPASEDAEASAKMMVDVFKPWPRWLTVLAIGVIPGVVEELWCRGFLGRGLLARYGWIAGVLLTSFFFGLLHLSPAYAVGTAMMGAALHFVYITTRSLWVPILLHFLNNTLSVLLGMGDLTIPHVDKPTAPPLLYLGSALLVAAVFYALYVSRGRLRAVGGGPPTWEPPFPSVALPPPGSGTEVHHEPPAPLAIFLVVAGAAAFGACWMLV